jgi:GT2 family glycosyltransferase
MQKTGPKPLVTVSVLSYQRRDAVVRVIESALAQDYPNLEVIVVDNGSGAELTGFLRNRFPQVTLIELSENAGTAARNRGIEAARGEIVVTLDNDVYFDDSRSVHRIVEAFERRPCAGCVVFRVYHPATGTLHVRDWCHPRPWKTGESQEFETHYITEGAAAFRRAVFDQIEPYWPLLFIGHEGADLGIRLMDAGYGIWYLPEVKVWHMASLETREDWRPFYYNTRNLFPHIYRNYPLLKGFAHLVPRVAVMALYALRAGALGRCLNGVVDGLRMLAQCRPLRKPVRRGTLRRITELKRLQPGMFQRFVMSRQRVMPLGRR